MARRTNTSTSTSPPSGAAPIAIAVEDRVVAFAEQLGRVVGTVQNKADGWLSSAALQEQLARVRDGAAELLTDLSGKRPKRPASRARGGVASARSSAAGRSGGKVDAPGKKHRKPPASVRGAKHSDETISKLKTARTVRAPRRG